MKSIYGHCCTRLPLVLTLVVYYSIWGYAFGRRNWLKTRAQSAHSDRDRVWARRMDLWLVPRLLRFL